MAHTSQSERSIHEMLRDTPSMNESSSAIHSGTEHHRIKHPSSLTLHNISGKWNLSSSPYAILGDNISQSLSPCPSVPNTPTVGLVTSPTTLQNGFTGGGSSESTFIKNSATKIDTIKNWSISTYKCTRQLMLEKLGKSTRTVDSELEAQIEQLRDTQRKYLQVLRLTRALSSHFHHVVQTQHCLSEAFSDLAQKSPELQEEFTYNSDTQRSLTKNGELLLSALNFFTSSVNTLCNKTIEDTLITIRQYETARIEYDAYRMDLEQSSSSRSDQRTPATSPVASSEEAQRSFAKHKEAYEKLRADIAVKMQFLDENRVRYICFYSVLLGLLFLIIIWQKKIKNCELTKIFRHFFF